MAVFLYARPGEEEVIVPGELRYRRIEVFMRLGIRGEECLVIGRDDETRAVPHGSTLFLEMIDRRMEIVIRRHLLEEQFFLQDDLVFLCGEIMPPLLEEGDGCLGQTISKE
jgi:hypothetical protein